MKIVLRVLLISAVTIFSSDAAVTKIDGSDDLPKQYKGIFDVFCKSTTCPTYGKKNVYVGCLPGTKGEDSKCQLKCPQLGSITGNCPGVPAKYGMGIPITELMNVLKAVKSKGKDINLEDWKKVEQQMIHKKGNIGKGS